MGLTFNQFNLLKGGLWSGLLIVFHWMMSDLSRKTLKVEQTKNIKDHEDDVEVDLLRENKGVEYTRSKNMKKEMKKKSSILAKAKGRG